MLHPFAPEIWLADGPQVVALAGFHYPTRMAVIRLADGGLILWSPVAHSARLQAQIEALGEVRHILAPNHLHHLAAGEWQRACPSALLHGAPGLRAKRPDLTIERDLGAAPAVEWAGQLDQALLDNRIAPEIALFHRASGTVLLTDLIQHLPRGWYRGWRAVVARLDGMTGPAPAVPRKFRLAWAKTPANRTALRQMLDWPAQRLVFAHGAPVEQDAQALLRRAFAWARP